MKDRSKVSIIVPVYNVESYLARCIDSILRQTYKNIEIILVDDGSTDKCGEICELYKEMDSRVRTIHKQNGGLSEARNYGISYATGEWISFVDSDDCISEKFIEILLKAAEKTRCKIVQCRYMRFNENIPKEKCEDKNHKIVENFELLNQIDTSMNTAAWNKLYCADLFEDILFPVGRIHEDVATTFKLVMKSPEICLVNEELYYYFMNPESITTSKIKNNKLDLIDAYWEQVEYFRKTPGYFKYSIDATNRLVSLFGTLVSYDRDRYENYNMLYNELLKRFLEMRKQLLDMPMRQDLKLLIRLSHRTLFYFKLFQKVKKLIHKGAKR